MKNQETAVVLRLVQAPNKVVFRETKSKRPLIPEGEKKIKMVDVVYDPETKMERTIAYVPGEKSLFLDKQSNTSLDKKGIAYLVFKGGYSSTPLTDKNKVKFIEMWNKNASNPNRNTSIKPVFELVDRKNEAEKSMRNEDILIDAKYTARKGEWEHIVAYAKAKGIKVDDMHPEEVRHAIRSMIRDVDSAQRFLDEYGSKKIRVKFEVIEALEDKILINDRHSRTIIWGDTRQAIINYPQGKNHVDVLTDFCLSPEGERAYQVIVGSINPKEHKKEAEKSVKRLTDADIRALKTYDAVELGIKELVIAEAEDGFRFNGIKCGGTKEKVHEHFVKYEQKVETLKDAIIASLK